MVTNFNLSRLDRWVMFLKLGAGVGACRWQSMHTNGIGLSTPRPSRNSSTTSLTAQVNSTAPMNFLGILKRNLVCGSFLAKTCDFPDPVTPVHFNGSGDQTSTLNHGVSDLEITFDQHDFDMNTPFPSADIRISCCCIASHISMMTFSAT